MAAMAMVIVISRNLKRLSPVLRERWSKKRPAADDSASAGPALNMNLLAIKLRPRTTRTAGFQALQTLFAFVAGDEVEEAVLVHRGDEVGGAN